MTPTPKTIGDITLVVDDTGWPRWTRLSIKGECQALLSPEDVHDLHYALSRIIAYLEELKNK